MPHYKKLYTFLFGKVTDAIEALEQNKAEKARQILIRASQEAEELYVTSDPEYAEYPVQPMAQSQFDYIMELLYDYGEADMRRAMHFQYPGLYKRYQQLSREERLMLPRPGEIEPSEELLDWMERELQGYYQTLKPWELDDLGIKFDQ